MQQIQKAGAPILGYIMNKVKTRQLGYGHYRYRYYYHSYYQRNSDIEDEEPSAETNGAASAHSSWRTSTLERMHGVQERVKRLLKR